MEGVARQATHGSLTTVLVVEDDPDSLALMSMALTDEGYFVLAARSGAEAMKLASGSCPDMAVLDLTLSDVAGESIGLALRHLHGKHVPVIVVSGAKDIADRARLGQAQHWLKKPFDMSDLLAAVDSVSRSSSAA